MLLPMAKDKSLNVVVSPLQTVVKLKCGTGKVSKSTIFEMESIQPLTFVTFKVTLNTDKLLYYIYKY